MKTLHNISIIDCPANISKIDINLHVPHPGAKMGTRRFMSQDNLTLPGVQILEFRIHQIFLHVIGLNASRERIFPS